jgi:hypothetical protein
MGDSPREAGEAGAAASSLGDRLENLGRSLGEREAGQREGLERARAELEKLRALVDEAIGRFHAGAAGAGAPHLQIEVSPVRVDDKHLRSVEFELERGRHKAIVTAKARGEVTLVGPFRVGKVEGPCLSFPFEARDELLDALAAFLERFAEEAATP